MSSEYVIRPTSQIPGPQADAGLTIQGVVGSLLIRLNVAAAVYRKSSYISEHPIMEVIGVTAVTGCISYLIVFLRYA